MSWPEIITTGITVLSFTIGPLVYLWNSIMLRINNLESELNTKISKEELQQRLEPVSEDIKEVKLRIDKILEHLLNDRKSR